MKIPRQTSKIRNDCSSSLVDRRNGGQYVLSDCYDVSIFAQLRGNIRVIGAEHSNELLRGWCVIEDNGSVLFNIDELVVDAMDDEHG